jgi:N,N'-diacetyllegionaminate synthase
MEIVGLADELSALKFLIEEKVDAIGIHAVCINEHFMLKHLQTIQQPLFIGIGGITLSEIEFALNMLSKQQVIMMYGIQHYPTPPQSIHLHKLRLYQTHFQLPVGYADHTASHDELTRHLVYATAYGLGVRIFEQHVTLDLAVKREDDEAAIEVQTFAQLKKQLELVSLMTGVTKLDLKEEERNYFSKIRKCMVAAEDLPKGILLTEDHIKFKRTEAQGDMEQGDFTQLVGKTLMHEVRKWEAFCWRHIRNI